MIMDRRIELRRFNPLPGATKYSMRKRLMTIPAMKATAGLNLSDYDRLPGAMKCSTF